MYLEWPPEAEDPVAIPKAYTSAQGQKVEVKWVRTFWILTLSLSSCRATCELRVLIFRTLSIVRLNSRARRVTPVSPYFFGAEFVKAQYRVWILVCFVLQVFVWSPARGLTAKADDFRVTPYLQQPEQTAVTVRWFSEENSPGRLTYWADGKPLVIDSRPEPSPELAYIIFKDEPGGPHPATPFRHTVRISPLQPGTRYAYRVEQRSQHV